MSFGFFWRYDIWYGRVESISRLSFSFFNASCREHFCFCEGELLLIILISGQSMKFLVNNKSANASFNWNPKTDLYGTYVNRFQIHVFKMWNEWNLNSMSFLFGHTVLCLKSWLLEIFKNIRINGNIIVVFLTARNIFSYSKMRYKYSIENINTLS